MILFSMSWLRLLSLVALSLVLLGGMGVYFSDRANYCATTYMFEYPQFVRITVPDNEKYPQYALYSYSEGRITERARKMRFDGIPVLYLHGNSGSRSQVRSLASVALRKAFSSEYDYHFDFFTVSFNEELSGLYGGVLQQQTEFTALSLQRILSLYKINKHMQSIPNTVVVIGHSMGGVIAKRLLVYPETQNLTNIAVTLAAPLAAPVLNFDMAIDQYYLKMKDEWRNSPLRHSKTLLSFGSGARDLMVPSNLISSEYSDFSALMTAVPGVWTSTDHNSMVWCKQFVLVFNKFLFSIVDKTVNQIVDDKEIIMTKALQYFQVDNLRLDMSRNPPVLSQCEEELTNKLRKSQCFANRSMTLNPSIPRASSLIVPDAFWYEDNRRIYQISRPDIKRMTYLMIRLVGFPQDRFVAIEAVNLDDRDWVFGCNAAYTHGPHRVCKNATSLSELSRWTGATEEFGLRKLATVHLHDLMMQQPSWTHVIVKISPTDEPIMLNVDINDHASRHLTVELSDLSFGTTVIKEETAQNALYYELELPGMQLIHHTYLLYVEPTASCKASYYHVSAEMHVPWARNNEYYHFFTHLKKKPMKLRLFKNHPNATNNSEVSENVKITLLLDPQCTFSISISPTRYHMLAQLVRQHISTLLPYMAAILLLATRSSLLSFVRTGKCESMHEALASSEVRPYHAVVFGRLGTFLLTTYPVITYVLETSGLDNAELRQLTSSLLAVPAYMAALGALNVLAAGALVAVLFCSQFAHRLLLRILWRGGGGTIAEKLAELLRRAPVLVSVALVCAVPASCGAAALAAGGAFYFFMLSKMYEEYLEDYAYRLLAKIGAKIRNYFKSGKLKTSAGTSESLALLNKPEDNSNKIEENQEEMERKVKNKTIESNKDKDTQAAASNNKSHEPKPSDSTDETKSNDRDELIPKLKDINSELTKSTVENVDTTVKESPRDVDEQINGLHFHSIMFFLWAIVTVGNVPALLTWARNFKYSMVLRPDTSFYPGIVMSLCAGFLWQMDGPRRNLKDYESVCRIIFVMAIFLFVMGPLATYYISYIVTAAFAIITLQQLFDSELPAEISEPSAEPSNGEAKRESNINSNVKNSEDVRCNTEDTIQENLRNMKEKFDLNDTDL